MQPEHALDCGAGIGRITKRLLLPIFDKVNMVEQDQHFCDDARTFIGPESSRVPSIFCQGLQDFSPEEKQYDLIWCQWVLGHLQDADLVQFFKRCKRGLKDGGYMVVKENTLEDRKKIFDGKDSSYTRQKEELMKCMADAGMDITTVQKQKGFPQNIYPVYMFALK